MTAKTPKSSRRISKRKRAPRVTRNSSGCSAIPAGSAPHPPRCRARPPITTRTNTRTKIHSCATNWWGGSMIPPGPPLRFDLPGRIRSRRLHLAAAAAATTTIMTTTTTTTAILRKCLRPGALPRLQRPVRNRIPTRQRPHRGTMETTTEPPSQAQAQAQAQPQRRHRSYSETRLPTEPAEADRTQGTRILTSTPFAKTFGTKTTLPYSPNKKPGRRVRPSCFPSRCRSCTTRN
mmetsp:Transcript_1202/g.2870  ORF Transcript_1202/g.2870 Transcript_1202/m.2870 type:complete len:234 (+) Transcript_1202:396-1097(+)